MALLANVALTNTFDTWRTRTNQLVTRINSFAINESSLYANTLTANSSFTSKGLGTFNGRVTIGTNLNVSGNTTIGAANKVANVTGWFGVTGRATVSTNLWVSGNTNIGAAGKVANVTGWFSVNGRQTISTNLLVGGNTTIGGTLTVSKSALQIVVSESTSNYAAFQRKAPTGQATYDFYTINNTEVARITATTGGWFVGTGSSATTQLTVAASGLITTDKSLTVTQNLTVSGNTVLNGTTTDRSNALSQTLTDGATINWDVSLGRVATVTLGAAGRTMAAPTNLKVGTYILRVYQDATGSRTITTWNSVFKWTAAVAPVLSTGANKLDIITFFSDGTNLYGSYLPDMR